MNKRLIWNFEISDEPTLDFLTLPHQEVEPHRWEIRHFWQDNTDIVLHGLNNKLLNIALYKIKEHSDIYYLIPNHTYNIKQRHHELLYKPLLLETNNCQEFGKKINLSTYPPQEILPGTPPITARHLLDILRSRSLAISVKKVALMYKLETKPKIKLELSYLIIRDKVYFSLCVEGRSHYLVNFISHHMTSRTTNQLTCSDYVRFLKMSINHDK